jgi:hypothetical protein
LVKSASFNLSLIFPFGLRYNPVRWYFNYLFGICQKNVSITHFMEQIA